MSKEIEKRIRRVRNELMVEEKRKLTIIARNETLSNRLKQTGVFDQKFIENQHKLSQSVIEDTKKELEDIRRQLLELDGPNGSLIIDKLSQQSTKDFNETNKTRLTAKRQARDEKERIKTDMYSKLNKNSGRRPPSEYALQKEYERFIDKSNSLSSGLRHKLKRMPNNQGYIFKGIHFYGALDWREDQHEIVYENRKGVTWTHTTKTFKDGNRVTTTTKASHGGRRNHRTHANPTNPQERSWRG